MLPGDLRMYSRTKSPAAQQATAAIHAAPRSETEMTGKGPTICKPQRRARNVTTNLDGRTAGQDTARGPRCVGPGALLSHRSEQGPTSDGLVTCALT
jgi:hypothetical protein